MLALWEMPKQQKACEECSMENIFQFLLMEDTQLICEKDEKYGRTQKNLVEFICYWLMVPKRRKWNVAYRKTSRNDYVNGPHVKYTLL
jgi:hypothetical protein